METETMYGFIWCFSVQASRTLQSSMTSNANANRQQNSRSGTGSSITMVMITWYESGHAAQHAYGVQALCTEHTKLQQELRGTTPEKNKAPAATRNRSSKGGRFMGEQPQNLGLMEREAMNFRTS